MERTMEIDVWGDEDFIHSLAQDYGLSLEILTMDGPAAGAAVVLFTGHEEDLFKMYLEVFDPYSGTDLEATKEEYKIHF